MKILVVEDDLDTRDGLKNLLEECGLDVRAASNLSEARAALTSIRERAGQFRPFFFCERSAVNTWGFALFRCCFAKHSRFCCEVRFSRFS